MSAIINSIIPSVTSTIISSGISLFLGLHNPRTKLEILTYRMNRGIEQYMNKPKIILQFCLLSNKVGWFKLTKVKYDFNIAFDTKNESKIIYDSDKDINNLPTNKHVIQFTSRIFVTSSNPSQLFSFDYSKLNNFKRTLEINSKSQNYRNNFVKISNIKIPVGNLKCYFKTNDKKKKKIVCTI